VVLAGVFPSEPKRNVQRSHPADFRQARQLARTRCVFRQHLKLGDLVGERRQHAPHVACGERVEVPLDLVQDATGAVGNLFRREVVATGPLVGAEPLLFLEQVCGGWPGLHERLHAGDLGCEVLELGFERG
jgi:hypothetical protein